MWCVTVITPLLLPSLSHHRVHDQVHPQHHHGVEGRLVTTEGCDEGEREGHAVHSQLLMHGKETKDCTNESDRGIWGVSERKDGKRMMTTDKAYVGNDW